MQISNFDALQSEDSRLLTISLKALIVLKWSDILQKILQQMLQGFSIVSDQFEKLSDVSVRLSQSLRYKCRMLPLHGMQRGI